MWFKNLIFFLFLSSIPIFSLANEEEKQGAFNTVDFIFDHVNDSHEWHFFSIGDKHISIPLPVILYSKSTGWHFFSSSKFIHPNPEFRFEIVKGGSTDKVIVEKMADGSQVAPLDLSITKTVFGALITAIVLIIIFLKISKKIAANPMTPPKGMQNMLEPVVLFIRDDIAKPFIGKKFERYLPYLLTLFSFILLANLLGLIIPFGFNITGNIATTMVLAAFTFVITMFSSKKHYWLHIVNPEVPWFMKYPVPLAPFIEFLGVFIKPIVLMVRLFANMFAGHMIVTVLVGLIFLMSTLFNPIVGFGTSIISVTFSVFMMIVDILIAFIQAYIFTLLSALYFGMVTDDGTH